MITVIASIIYYSPRIIHCINAQQGCCVYFINVGKADCALIELKDGKRILVDAGELFIPGTQINFYENYLKPWLKKRGIKSFDIVVATHPHSDHIGGITGIIEEFPVKTIVDHGYKHPSFLYEKFLKIIRKKRLYVLHPSAGDELRIGNKTRLLFLSPYKGMETGDLNEDSLVLKFIYGRVSFLFMADAGIPAENFLLHSMKKYLKSDILKVGHHGSKYSSSPQFLEEASPQYAVIQSGQDNKFGHPHLITLKNLRRRGIVILRNDQLGDIKCLSDQSVLSCFGL